MQVGLSLPCEQVHSLVNPTREVLTGVRDSLGFGVRFPGSAWVALSSAWSQIRVVSLSVDESPETRWLVLFMPQQREAEVTSQCGAARGWLGGCSNHLGPKGRS